jgi:hypothetical protein
MRHSKLAVEVLLILYTANTAVIKELSQRYFKIDVTVYEY